MAEARRDDLQSGTVNFIMNSLILRCQKVSDTFYGASFPVCQKGVGHLFVIQRLNLE